MWIGPYEVTGELGRGGMGVVYAVRHPDDPRPLALKLLRRGAAGNTLARFEREAAVMARVSHPHVARIVSAGQLPEGPFLLLERVEGESLEALSQRAPLAPAEAARIGAEVASGLAALHAAGVVHRDVKPANVMLRADRGAVLLDLGLAHEESAEALTKTGQLLGTPAFMSPEQAAGRHHLVDARSDVYSLGASLFACLTGRPPFEADSIIALARAILQDDPTWPDDLHPWLLAVLRRAMQKERDDRYATAEELALDLRAFAAGERPRAAAAAEADRRRVRLALAGGGAVALVALGALAAPLASIRPGDPPSASGRAADASASAADAGAPASATPPGVEEGSAAERAARLAQLPARDRVDAAAAWLRAHRHDPAADEVRSLYVSAKLAAGPTPLEEAGASSRFAWRDAHTLVLLRAVHEARTRVEVLVRDVTRPERARPKGRPKPAAPGPRPVVGPGVEGPVVLFPTYGGRAGCVVLGDTVRWATNHEGGVARSACVALSRDARWVAVGYDRGPRVGRVAVYPWELILTGPGFPLTPFAWALVGPRVRGVAFLDAHTLLVHAEPADRLQRWRIEQATGALVEERVYPLPAPALRFAVHPSRRWVAVASAAPWSLHLISLEDGATVSELVDPALQRELGASYEEGFLRESAPPAHGSTPVALSFSPDGGLLYSVAGRPGYPSEVKVWRTGPDPATHRLWAEPLVRPRGPVFQDAALSPDGRRLVTLSFHGDGEDAALRSPGILELWDVASEPD